MTTEESFEERMALLSTILDKGMTKLLLEVRSKNISSEPYGRAPLPTPLMTEEQYLLQQMANGGGGVEEDDEPQFKFSYGFNPLSFLADYVLWSHPDSLLAREAARVQACERLQQRAAHAMRQLDAVESLRDTTTYQGSGIMWGPITSPLSSTSVTCLVRVIRSGLVVAQLAIDESFANVLRSQEILVQEGETVAKLTFGDLKAGTQYFVRCCLDEQKKQQQQSLETAEGEEQLSHMPFTGIDMNLFQTSSFFTLPSMGDDERFAGDDAQAPSEESKAPSLEDDKTAALVPPVYITCLPSRLPRNASLPQSLTSASPSASMTCLLGDIFSSSNNSSSIVDENEYRKQIWSLYCSSVLAKFAKSNALVLSWNDVRAGSDVDLRSEEVTHKQFLQDMKRFEKKYGTGKSKSSSSSSKAKKDPPPVPVLNRPPLSTSLSLLLEAFPVECAQGQDSATRHLYRSYMHGPHVEVFVLDLRCGILGKQQAKWLREGLSRSGAFWKIVLAGAPIGITLMSLSSQGERSEGGHGGRQSHRNTSRSAALVDMSEMGGSSSSQRVQMDVPEQGEEDLDEYGRSKSSLSYLIFSLQRAAEREAQMRLNDGNSVDESTNAEAEGDASIMAEPESFAKEDDETSVADAVDENASLDDSELLDSAIVFITNSQAGTGWPVLPYAATFDPLKVGRSFCAEINLGANGDAPPVLDSSRPSSSSKSSTTSVRISPHLEARFLFGDETILATSSSSSSSSPSSSSPNPQYACSLSLLGDGALSVKISRLPGETNTSSDEVVLFEKLFRGKASDEATPETED